jgi:hypothetical protein
MADRLPRLGPRRRSRSAQSAAVGLTPSRPLPASPSDSEFSRLQPRFGRFLLGPVRVALNYSNVRYARKKGRPALRLADQQYVSVIVYDDASIRSVRKRKV